MVVDATNNTNDVVVNAGLGALDFFPGDGGNTITGGDGPVTIASPNDPFSQGTVCFVGGNGPATVDGSQSPTIVGGQGSILLNQNGYASVIGGARTITIVTDGNSLSISRPDSLETLNWAGTTGDTLQITTDGTGLTTVVDVTAGTTTELLVGAIVNVIDGTAGGPVADIAGDNVINLGATDATVTASQGTDTINAGTGDLTVDASGNANPIVVNAATADQLTFVAGPGDATISGGATATIVTGGVGNIALAQHGLTMINAGDGTITVTADGSLLTVIGEDGVSTANWPNVAAGDTVTIATDSATHATTLTDTNSGATTVLADGYATNHITAFGGTISDLPDHNVITLIPFGLPTTIIASQGTDTINGSGMPDDVTVDASGNANPIVVNATGPGTLTFTAGGGGATLTGSSGGTTINGGTGPIALTQHGATTVHAGNGPITVTTDGAPLTVFGADGTSNGNWTFAATDTVTITTDSVNHVTTVSDPSGSLTYTLPTVIAPTVTIDPVNAGATLNANAAAVGFTISGSTDVEDGQVVSVRILDGDSNPVGSPYQATASGGAWTLVVPGSDHLADGGYTVTADVMDQANHSAPEASGTLTVDETAPTVTITGTPGLTNHASQTVSGTAEAGGMVTVSDGVTSVGSAVVGVDGKWSTSVTLTGDGPHTLTASEADAAGNTGSSNGLGYTLDTTPPVLAVTSTGGLTNNAGQTVSGTGEAGRTIVLLDGATLLGTATVALDGTWSTHVTLSGEGSHILTVSETDAANNASGRSISYTLDTTPPTAPVITSAGMLTNDPALTVSGTTNSSEAGGTVIVWDGATSVGSGAVGLNGNWSANVTLTNGDGMHSLTAIETDAAGNTGANSAAVDYTLDTTPPAPPVITSTDVLTNDPAQTVSGTGEAGGTVAVWDGATPVGSAIAGDDGSWTANVTLTTDDGTHSLTASETDAAGNTGASSDPVDYTLDTTPPIVTITGTPGLTKEASQIVSGTAEAGGTVTVWDGATSVGSAIVGGNGTWSTSVTLTGDGSHSVTASETDAAGNTGSSNGLGYTLDTTPPALTVTSTGGPVNQAAVTLNGTGEVGRTVVVLDGATPLGTAVVGTDSTWSAQVTLAGEWPHTLTVSETDAAGNASASSVSYTLDVTPPAAPVITSMGGLTNDPNQTVSGTGEAGGTVVVWDGAASVGSATVGLDGTWSSNVTLTTGDGTHGVTAQETDAAGNTGASSAAVDYTLDTTPPVVTITGAGGLTNDPSQTVSGTAEAGGTVVVWDGAASVGSAAVGLDGTWSTSVTLTGDGAHSLTAGDTDAAGNTGSSGAVAYTLDTTPPVLTITPFAQTLNAGGAAVGFTISGTTDAEDGQVVSVRILDGDSNPVGSPYQATVTGGAWSLAVPGSDHLADGGYTVTADVMDQASNPAMAASQPLTVDETAPMVAIDPINGGATLNAGDAAAGLILSGTTAGVEDGQTVTISVSDGTDPPLAYFATVAGSTWSVPVPANIATALADGSYTITASVSDRAGNPALPASRMATVDETAPRVTIVGTGGPTNQASQTLSGTGEAGAMVILWDGAASVGSATVGSDGTWSTGVTLAGEGSHSLTAQETDAAGNTGSSGTSVDYTLDTAPATVAITSLGRLTNQATQTVSGTVDPTEAGRTVTVWEGSTALGVATAAADGSWSAAIALAGDGSHSLIATETDAAGNTGISNAVTFTLDTTPVAAGDNGNPYAGAIGQRLAELLGASGGLTYFGPNQPVPDPSTGTPALLISGNDGTPVTVPFGVAIVRNQAAGVDLRGSGQDDQVVVSSVGFTYHSNGGSGVVLADDAQAGGPAGNSNIVLARSGGGDFVISTGSGDDTVDAASGNVSVAAGGGHNMIWLGSGDALVTSAGVDTVVSGTGAATVQATAGSEALVFGGASTLTFVGGAGAATVVGGAGSTNLVAGSGNAVFWGSANGGNTMYAGTGAATLVGGGSGNVIHAGGSADLLLVAGTGNSTLVGGGATGNNFYWGSQGDDVISADQGNDTIIGGPGHDTIQAGGGNALIFGGVDGDTFVAGSGSANIVSGNGGANTFAFINGQAGGTEVIWGFRSGTDHLSLQGYGANELANATAGAHGYGPGTEIGLSDGTKIVFGDIATLKGTTLS